MTSSQAQSRQFRASLPTNRTNSSAIGYDLLSGNGRGGNSSSGLNSSFSGLPARNSLASIGAKGYGQRPGSVSMGVELYYGGNRRVGTPHTNKRGALRRGLSSNKPSLAAIQNTQNSLVAGLGSGHSGSVPAASAGAGGQTKMYDPSHSQTAAARLASHLRPLGEQNGISGEGTGISTTAKFTHQQTLQQQQQNVKVEINTPAQAAAAAAAAVVASAKAERSRKTVRWAHSLVSEVPIAPKTSHRNNENVPVNSILSVGGQPDYAQRYPSNKKTGVSAAMASSAGENEHKKATQQQGNSRIIDSDSAASVIAGNGGQGATGVGVGAVGKVGARPHTSGSLESSMLDRQQVEGTNGNISRRGAGGSHVPLLAMRRNQQSQRPTLSEQLAAITADADALAKDIRAKGGLDKDDNPSDPAIVVLPAKSFSVGTLCCRYPSPTRYFRDRIEYTFHHPYENSEVHMVMHYCDMIQTALAGGRLKFKLPRRLVHFSSDFDPNNPTHVIAIELGTSAASTIIREKIMPIISTGQSATGFVGAHVRKGF